MVNGYGATVEIAFLTQEYSDTPTFRHQSQLSQEKFHPRFHTLQEIRVQPMEEVEVERLEDELFDAFGCCDDIS